MSPDVPVLVVGGGPAGAVTALLLARAGWDVELVDRTRFPRGKACGECLSPGGVAALARIGLLRTILGTKPALLEGWEMGSPGSTPAVGRFGRGDAALGIERSSFDHALLRQASREGVQVREGVRVVHVDPGTAERPATAHLRHVDGTEEVRAARLLVGADGLHSRVAADIGLTLPLGSPRKASLSWRIGGSGPSRHRGRLVLGDGLTVGLAPVGPSERARWNATLVVDPRLRPGVTPVRGWPLLLEMLDDAARTGRGDGWHHGPMLLEGPWGAGSFRRPTCSAASGRVLLVGDAAGYFDPLTGQGIYRALRSAELAASFVDRHLLRRSRSGLRPADPPVLQAYARTLRRTLHPGRTLQTLVEAVVSRPRVRRPALAGLRRAPALTSALVRLTGDRPGTLLRPGTRSGQLATLLRDTHVHGR